MATRNILKVLIAFVFAMGALNSHAVPRHLEVSLASNWNSNSDWLIFLSETYNRGSGYSSNVNFLNQIVNHH